MTEIKNLSEEVLSQLSKEEKDFLLSWKKLCEDKDFQNKIKELTGAELEKLLKSEKVKTVYDLEKWDKCFFIRLGRVWESVWENNDLDGYLLDVGNVFLTEEEAENELEYRKIKAELKRYASKCKEPIDWNNSVLGNHYVCYDYLREEIKIKYDRICISDNIYFTDRRILEKAIEEIGKDRIIKYYFGINN